MRYGWRRLLLCFALPGLLARVLGGRGTRYIEAFLWLDLVFLVANVVVDRGLKEGVRRLPEEMGLTPVRQERRHLALWPGLGVAWAFVLTAVTPRIATLVQRASQQPAGRFLNWTPILVDWFPADHSFRRIMLYYLPLNIVAEECYIHGLLWSRMAWLGRWRPIANAAAWAFYHFNRPVKDMAGAILPATLLASYTRAQSQNVYVTAVGHYASNAFFSWRALQDMRSGREQSP